MECFHVKEQDENECQGRSYFTNECKKRRCYRMPGEACVEGSDAKILGKKCSDHLTCSKCGVCYGTTFNKFNAEVSYTASCKNELKKRNLKFPFADYSEGNEDVLNDSASPFDF